MASFAIFWSFVGGVGLILLSIFDTKRHERLHRVFLLIFVLGVALSAIFTVIEVRFPVSLRDTIDKLKTQKFRWLNLDYQGVRSLYASYVTKAILAFVLIILAIAFGSIIDRQQDVAAVLEWTIAFGFTLYLLTFFWDLRHNSTDPKAQHNDYLTNFGSRSSMHQVNPTYPRRILRSPRHV